MLLRLTARFLASALVLGGVGGCDPVDENVPSISGFNIDPPFPPREKLPGGGTNSGGNGGTLDLSKICDGDPAASVGVDCDVSFQADVYPVIVARCASGGLCHQSDNTFGAKLEGDANTYWNLLRRFPFRDTENKPLPYINICSTNPADSAISCSLVRNGTSSNCGSPMPPPANEKLTAAELSTLDAWLACGAPNN